MRIVILAAYADSVVRLRGDLIRSMLDHGHDVDVVVPGADKVSVPRLFAEKVGWHNVPLNRTGMNPFHDLLYLCSVVALLRSLRPDVVFSYTIKPAIWGGVAAIFFRKIKYYPMLTGLGYAFTEIEGPRKALAYHIARYLLKIGLRRADVVIFQNQDDRNQILGLGSILADKTTVVPGSGIDIDRFQPKDDVPNDHVRFLLIARLLRDKGVYEYAAAARDLSRRYPQAEFHLVGWIDDNPTAIRRDDLENWISEGFIQYHGILEDVRPVLADCTVYVLPSYREGMPRTVLEAMAMGRAVITTDVPGCRETVNDGESGILVPPRSTDALKKAMEKFLNEPALAIKMGQSARVLAAEKFDVRKVNHTLLTLMGLTQGGHVTPTS